MTEGWDKMTAVERQDAFLAKWASGEGLSFADPQAQAAYQYRAGLIKDALQLKQKPDRAPVIPLETFAHTMLAGASGKQAMYDAAANGQAAVDFVRNYEPDAAGISAMIMHGPALETLDYRLYKWPGHGVGEHLSYQFLEKEYMKPEEYDHLIADPTDYWLRVWLPRTHAALEPLATLPPVYGTMELPMSAPWLIGLGTPPVQQALQALMEAGKQCFDWIQQLGAYVAQVMSLGFPLYAGGATKAPFDTLSDSFRGTTHLMMDLYRRPDKVIEAVNRLVQPMVSCGASGALAHNNPLVFIPLHKGADGFVSNAQFEKFYWPSLKALMYQLAEAGCVPCCFVEGGYNQRLEFLEETSDIRCLYIFDRTDMARARQILGGKVAIGGGFPVSLILTGTPQQVSDETQKLLDVAAGDGGYILTIGCAMDQAREETMKAFMEAGRKYGKY